MLAFCSKIITKWLFGNVTAGEVHPQPHIISYGKGKKCFSLVGPTTN
jgi:hypothetical protein